MKVAMSPKRGTTVPATGWGKFRGTSFMIRYRRLEVAPSVILSEAKDLAGRPAILVLA
jgi:hypothetical protein